MNKRNMPALALAACLCLGAMWSCYDDKGNYDYKDIHGIVIDTAGKGIKAAYSVTQFEQLQIPVGITLNGNSEENLSFQWSSYPDDANYTATEEPYVLCERKQFDEQVPMAPGNYILLYTVTDKTTGVRNSMRFKISVSSSLKSGWMVFYESGAGESDVAIINDVILDNTITKNQVLTDIFSRVNKRKLQGVPVDINHHRWVPFYGIYRYTPSIFVFTDKEWLRVSDQDFSLLGPVTDVFIADPAVQNFQRHFIYGSSGVETAINNGKVHVINLINSSGVSAWQPFPVEVLGSYYAEPFVVTRNLGASWAIFYDRLNKKFRFTNSTLTLLDFPTQTTGSPAWDPRNVGMDMIWMESGFSNLTLALFQSGSDRYLCTANFQANNTDVAKLKLPFTGPGTSDAKYFTMGEKGHVMLYANDTKAYTFDYAASTPSTKEQWTAPAGETITCMRLFRGNDLTGQNPNSAYIRSVESKYIFIATYKEATGEGFLYRYQVDVTTGDVNKSTEVKYSGFGKIRKMAQRSTT